MIDYNPKIDYLICKYLLNTKIEIQDEQLWKDIYFYENCTNNEEQCFMLKAKKVQAYIKNEKTDFNLVNIIHCYKSIIDDCYKVNPKVIEKTKNIIEMFKNNYSADLAAIVFIYVLENKVFDHYNAEMAKIIHNFIQLKRGYVPAIIYYFQTDKVIQLIQKKEIDGAILEVKKCYIRTKHFNTFHRLIFLEEIITKLNKERNYLKDKFKVQELYIYGSYSKKTYNEYSDLDLLIKVYFDSEYAYQTRFKIFDYLEKQIGIEIDGIIIDFREEKENLKEEIKKNLKRIF